MRALLAFVVTAVLLPVMLSELTEWCPTLAVRLVRWSARRLGQPEACARYEEEWVANLNEVPGKLSRLVAALGYLLFLPRMRLVLRRTRANRAPRRLRGEDSIASLLRIDATATAGDDPSAWPTFAHGIARSLATLRRSSSTLWWCAGRGDQVRRPSLILSLRSCATPPNRT